jgi:hypothetical protein
MGESIATLSFSDCLLKFQRCKFFTFPRVWRFAAGESGGGFAAVGKLRLPPNARVETGW